MSNHQGGYYPETNGTSSPWKFPIAFTKKPFYTNGSADRSDSAYGYDYPAWAMALNKSSFLCSLNYDKTGDTSTRSVRVIAIGV